MANQIIPKKSVVAGKVPTAGDLGLGEVSINHADRVFFSRHPQTGSVQQIGAAPVHTHVLTDITDLNTLVLDADWNDIKNKPATFPPSSHSHTLSDITQSSATSGQVPTWSGTAWVPQAPPTGTNADWSATSGAAQILNKPTLGTAAASNSSDFATASQGTKADTASQPGHTHAAADISGLAAVAASGSYIDLTNKPTLGTAAATSVTDYATAAQGTKADTASQPGHTHTLSDLTQSSATTGQVATWSGTAWVPQTPSAGGSSSLMQSIAVNMILS